MVVKRQAKTTTMIDSRALRTMGLGTTEQVTRREKERERERMQPRYALYPEERGRRMAAWTRNIDAPAREIFREGRGS